MSLVKLLPWPNGHRCPFLLRDDDVSYFTKPDTLRKLYEFTWQRKFVVSFSVIPNIACNIPSYTYTKQFGLTYTPMVPPDVRGKPAKYKISNNPELIEFLQDRRKNEQADLILHGFTHERINNIPEFLIRNKLEIRDRLEAAIDLFQKTFHSNPKTFLPPREKISKEAWSNIVGNGLNLCRNFPLFLKEYFSSFSKGYFPLRPHPRLRAIFPWFGVNYATFYDDTYEFRSNGFFFSFIHDPERQLKAAKRIFKREYDSLNVSIWSLHHWEFFFDWNDTVTQKKHQQNLEQFLNYVAQYDVWKCGFTELADWLTRFKKVQATSENNGLSIVAGMPIKNLTIYSPKECSLTGLPSESYESREDMTIIREMPANQLVKIKVG